LNLKKLRANLKINLLFAYIASFEINQLASQIRLGISTNELSGDQGLEIHHYLCCKKNFTEKKIGQLLLLKSA
jgi:hypothetical protein